MIVEHGATACICWQLSESNNWQHHQNPNATYSPRGPENIRVAAAITISLTLASSILQIVSQVPPFNPDVAGADVAGGGFAVGQVQSSEYWLLARVALL